MALDVELAFETPGEHVQEAGTRVYLLYRTGDHYVLPDVVLRSAAGAQRVNVRQVGVSSVDPGTAPFAGLAAAIRDEWTRTATGGWIVGRREVAMRTVLPADLVDAVLGATAGKPAEMTVTWHYVYRDFSGAESARKVMVWLHFQPRGMRPPLGGGQSAAEAEVGPQLPDPVRHRTGRQYNGFAAIDFGTSSSAVAVYDARRLVPRSIDIFQAAQLRGELAALLLSSPDPSSLAPLWDQERVALLKTVADKLSGYTFTDIDGLVAELTGPTADERASLAADPVLDAVCLALEQRVAECKSPELAGWLAPRLLRCLDSAFLTPDLDEQQISEVVFDRDRSLREISSGFQFVQRHPVEIKLGRDKQADPISLRLKAEMFDKGLVDDATVPGGKDSTVEDLVARVYQELATRTEDFLRPDQDAEAQPLVHIVATYPTATLPANRHRLERLLEHCLVMDKVVTDFDEGVAAGLFFLMRDFSTQRIEFGADALRARARQVSVNPPAWLQTMLIIDIGAGTTDIALIGLTLEDKTEDNGGNPLVRGRYYVIRPEVLNSTGHRQLGGNYLTLRVLYWLKAAILDTLVTSSGDPASRAKLADRLALTLGQDAVGHLAEMVAGGSADEPAPREVAEALKANLPTHTEDGSGRPTDEFWLLWDLAEEAKIALSMMGEEEEKQENEPSFPIDHALLQPVLRAIDARKTPGLPELIPLLPKDSLRLPVASFTALVRPVLGLAAELAAWLVRTTFETGADAPQNGPTPRLDRVVLSGKTSKMPLLSDVVTGVLSGDSEAGRRLAWNPAALQVEVERAKQAAAIGACWAQVFVEHDAGSPDEGELAKGRSLATFDVKNLFRSLPCGFHQLLVGTQTKRLLRAGTRMVEADGTGRLIARSGWEPLVPLFEVHRPNGPSESIQWGVFRYYNHRDPDGFRPSPGIWAPGVGGGRGSSIMAQLEVDQALTPYLYLCRGNPHYYLGVAQDMAFDLQGKLGAESWDPRELQLRGMPAAILVRGTGDPEELFPAWQPGENEGIAAYFPVFCHVQPDVPSPAIRGRISAALPEPSEDGYFTFTLRWPDGSTKNIGKPSVAGPRGGSARYVTSLDSRGVLRIHRGDPPYWAAQSLRDVEEHAGSIRRVQMDPGEDELKASWKPFDGKH